MLAQEPAEGLDLVGVGGFSWSLEFRVGSEGLEGLEGTKLSKHPKLSKLLFPFSNSNSELELKRQNLLFAVVHCDSG